MKLFCFLIALSFVRGYRHDTTFVGRSGNRSKANRVVPGRFGQEPWLRCTRSSGRLPPVVEVAQRRQCRRSIRECINYGWPEDASAFDGVDCVVMYGDGGRGHMVMRHLDEMDALAKKGIGIVCLHYGVEVPKGPAGEKFLEWIGGYFETDWSVNPHWTANFSSLPDHPITRGVKPFAINDEWYYHMRFPEGCRA